MRQYQDCGIILSMNSVNEDRTILYRILFTSVVGLSVLAKTCGIMKFKSDSIPFNVVYVLGECNIHSMYVVEFGTKT